MKIQYGNKKIFTEALESKGVIRSATHSEKTNIHMCSLLGLPMELNKRLPKDKAALINKRGEIMFIIDLAKANFGIKTI